MEQPQLSSLNSPSRRWDGRRVTLYLTQGSLEEMPVHNLLSQKCQFGGLYQYVCLLQNQI